MKQRIIIEKIMNGYMVTHYLTDYSSNIYTYNNRFEVADHIEEALNDKTTKQMEIKVEVQEVQEVQTADTVRTRMVRDIQKGTVKPIHWDVAQVGVGKKSIGKNTNRKGQRRK